MNRNKIRAIERTLTEIVCTTDLGTKEQTQLARELVQVIHYPTFNAYEPVYQYLQIQFPSYLKENEDES